MPITTQTYKSAVYAGIIAVVLTYFYERCRSFVTGLLTMPWYQRHLHNR